MTLARQVNAELNALGATNSPTTITVHDGAARLTLDVIAVDSLACAFDRLAFHPGRRLGASAGELKDVGQQLSSRLTYLLEPIAPIEMDAEGCVVQLRSQPPHQDDDGTSYYELLVRRDEISLSRFAKTPGDVRRRVPAHLTREVLARLIADFAAS